MMLVIRKPQLAALSHEHEHEHDRALARELIPKVIAAIPAFAGALGTTAIEAVIYDAIADGRGFGLETDQELGELVGLVFACGERFYEREEYAWAKTLLESGRPTGVREVGLRRTVLATPSSAADPDSRRSKQAHAREHWPCQ